MTHTIKMFLKFGSLEHVTDLYENGTLYLNTIEYFRKVEDDKTRGDEYEGASRVVNLPKGKFRIPGIPGEYDYENIHFKESYEQILGNIYCLYCISSFGFPDPLKFQIDQRNLAFGSHCLMIKDTQYFYHRIQQELKNQGLKFYHDFVRYYDKHEINRALNVFDKSNEYEYQKEFRFHVVNSEIKPITLKIGSLKDYSEILTMREIMELRLQKN